MIAYECHDICFIVWTQSSPECSAVTVTVAVIRFAYVVNIVLQSFQFRIITPYPSCTLLSL